MTGRDRSSSTVRARGARSVALTGRRQVLFAGAAMAWVDSTTANAAESMPAELRSWLPRANLCGSTRFNYWGFAVYDASLWVQSGFKPQQFERSEFALQLRYLRDFTNAAITRRSVEEMARQSPPAPEQRQQWVQWLQGAFPDVRIGDRITGINRPDDGAIFLTNGRETGRVLDARFARLFFGIWLSADTSEPAMRQALLTNAAGA